MITADILRRIMPKAGARAEQFAPHLDAARHKWVGDNPVHVAQWLAQIAHESGQLRYVREIADGSAYEGRADLGNVQDGDGPRFRGRGLIQLTGRSNYERYSQAAGVDFVGNPELLELPAYAADSAGWFWHANGLAALADALDPVLACTKRINGGTNGLQERRTFYASALAALAPDAAPSPVSADPGPLPAPIVESTPITPPARKESPMLPALLAALLPNLLSALPELARVIKNDNVPERNIAIAKKAFEVIIPAVSAANAQEAVDKITNDPQALATAREAVAPMLEIIEVGGGIPAARKFTTDILTSTAPSWAKVGWGFTIAVLAFGIIFGGGYVMGTLVLDPQADPQLKAGILEYAKNLGLIVGSFAFGSSVGSRNKDAR